MVFETIVDPKIAEKMPWVTLILGIAYSTFSLFIGMYILPQYVSIGIVLFTTLFFLPLFHNTMNYEEKKDLEVEEERQILIQHSKALMFFIYLFIGLTISFAFWYVVFDKSHFLDSAPSRIFEAQMSTIKSINAKATEPTLWPMLERFAMILQNNMRVLLFCILFSFIFGAGAIFILCWNSSVIGAALGSYISALMAPGVFTSVILGI
jgi:hypothetical protein